MECMRREDYRKTCSGDILPCARAEMAINGEKDEHLGIMIGRVQIKECSAPNEALRAASVIASGHDVSA